MDSLKTSRSLSRQEILNRLEELSIAYKSATGDDRKVIKARGILLKLSLKY